jgi:signal transduction histidine kinase
VARDEPSLAGKLLLAQEAERRRIAKELHSGVGQQIAAVSLIASNLKRKLVLPGDEPLAEFALMHMKLSELARELHNLSRQLYPAVLEHSGIVAALESLTKGMQIEFEAQGEFDRLSMDESLCLYRVAEGALKNTTQSASVKLRVVGDAIELEVSEPTPENIELAIIRERALLVGGEVQNALGGIRFILPRRAR